MPDVPAPRPRTGPVPGSFALESAVGEFRRLRAELDALSAEAKAGGSREMEARARAVEEGARAISRRTVDWAHTNPSGDPEASRFWPDWMTLFERARDLQDEAGALVERPAREPAPPPERITGLLSRYQAAAVIGIVGAEGHAEEWPLARVLRHMPKGTWHQNVTDAETGHRRLNSRLGPVKGGKGGWGWLLEGEGYADDARALLEREARARLAEARKIFPQAAGEDGE